MVASISYNANDLIFQYSNSGLVPAEFVYNIILAVQDSTEMYNNAKTTTSKRGFLSVLVMPGQQVQE